MELILQSTYVTNKINSLFTEFNYIREEKLISEQNGAIALNTYQPIAFESSQIRQKIGKIEEELAIVSSCERSMILIGSYNEAIEKFLFRSKDGLEIQLVRDHQLI